MQVLRRTNITCKDPYTLLLIPSLTAMWHRNVPLQWYVTERQTWEGVIRRPERGKGKYFPFPLDRLLDDLWVSSHLYQLNFSSWYRSKEIRWWGRQKNWNRIQHAWQLLDQRHPPQHAPIPPPKFPVMPFPHSLTFFSCNIFLPARCSNVASMVTLIITCSANWERNTQLLFLMENYFHPWMATIGLGPYAIYARSDSLI